MIASFTRLRYHWWTLISVTLWHLSEGVYAAREFIYELHDAADSAAVRALDELDEWEGES